MGKYLRYIALVRLDEFFSEIERTLASNVPRVIFGVIGKPGAGKSTVSQKVKERFPEDDVAIISMDGYHLSNEVLDVQAKRDRKGAPDTFDVDGFVTLLAKVKSFTNEKITFPIFHREIEASVADEGVIFSTAKLIIVEGNYLLSIENGWGEVRQYLDKSWVIKLPDEVRMARLIRRHAESGKSHLDAESWARGSDENNAQFIAGTEHLADFTLEVD